MVFQNYSLLPWLTVRENVQLAVDQVFESESKFNRFERVRESLEMVKLTDAVRKRLYFLAFLADKVDLALREAIGDLS